VLFVGGIITGSSTTASQVAGAVLIGVALGAAAGLIIYGGLSRIPARHVFGVTNVLIALLAGSIASQLMKSLSQAGFIDWWTSPVWDTTRLLSPDSALGTFLHALVGYDATPSGAQIASYAAVLALIYFGTRLAGGGERPRSG
jgi:high-affinity iron transporter